MSDRYYQVEATDAIFDYWSETPGNPLVDMATGCHAAGTKILMYDGTTKPIELVAANDNLMGPDSKPRRVLRTVTGREMMYRIVPTKGEPFVVNEGHILSLKLTRQGAAKERFPSGRTAGKIENISLTDWLTKASYWKHLRKLWRTGVDFDYAANDNLPVPAYIVGAMLGDGSLIRSVGFTNMDQEVIEEVCSYAASLGVNKRVTQKPGNRAFGIFFPDDLASKSNQNRFAAALDEAGIWGMVCEQKAIPHTYKTGSRNTRLEILAGLLDTDGHLSDGTHFDFISKSETLSRDVTFVARSLGFAAYVSECTKFCQTGGGGTYWRVSISGNIDIIPTRVARQKAKPRLQKKNPLVTGFTVEQIGIGEYFGFALDGDHLYLTADFTVHHNTGKSRTMARLDTSLISQYNDLRIVNATHVVELVEGNFKELIDYSPFAPAGIFAASLGRRDAHSQIVFSQIQTVYNKAKAIGHVDVLKIDEAHLVPMDQATQYRGFIADLLAINPDMKICGFTATPYRLDSGRLDEGDDKIFDQIVYTYGIRKGIDDGYLTPITSTPTSTRQDVSGVGKLGGDFKKGALAKAVDIDPINRRILEEVFDVEGHRRKSLFFCAGVEHATHVRDLVRETGKRTCEVIHGGTPAGERRDIIAAYKRGEIWGVTNDNVMSTGTNVPGIDLIVDMAPTASANRYVQRVGRGTRPIYPPGFDPEAFDAAARRLALAGYIKPNCRYMDFAGNLNRHGPVDMIEPKKPGKGDGEAPIKICPQDEGGCGEQLHASVCKCWNCGHEFPEPETKLQERSADAPIISTAETTWRTVSSRRFDFHEGKGDKPPSVKVTYMAGLTAMREWVCPEHQGYPKNKADRYWHKFGGARPFPKTVLEWLERQRELNGTAEIAVKPDGKYWTITDHKVGAANDNEPSADNDNASDYYLPADADDLIPF